MNGGRQAGHLQEILEHGLGSIWVEIHHVLVYFFIQGSYQWFFLGIILSMLILARGVGQLYGGTNENFGRRA